MLDSTISSKLHVLPRGPVRIISCVTTGGMLEIEEQKGSFLYSDSALLQESKN
jgi:hypothetical protein